jgi:hypothetical protein
MDNKNGRHDAVAAISIFKVVWVAYILILKPGRWALLGHIAFSPYASRTGKTAHRKRRTCKAEEVVLYTRHAQAHFFCANGVLSGYRRCGTYATLP